MIYILLFNAIIYIMAAGTAKFIVKPSTPVLGWVHYRHYLLYVYYVDGLSSKGFSCVMSWIKLCVPSWSSTLTCRYSIRLMSNPWTCLWRLSWTCECYLFQCLLGCAAEPRWVCVPVAVPRMNFSRRSISWTRTSFIWLTTFSGICHSRTWLMPIG